MSNFGNLATSYQPTYHDPPSSDEEDSLPPSTFHPSEGGAHRYRAVTNQNEAYQHEK